MLQVTATTVEDQALCPIRNVLANVNGIWQPPIVFALEDGALRFSALKRTVGDITQRVLTENLCQLCCVNWNGRIRLCIQTAFYRIRLAVSAMNSLAQANQTADYPGP